VENRASFIQLLFWLRVSVASFSFFYESFGSPHYCSLRKFNLVIERGSQFVTLSTKYRCRCFILKECIDPLREWNRFSKPLDSFNLYSLFV
jgi:hypothetical protein